MEKYSIKAFRFLAESKLAIKKTLLKVLNVRSEKVCSSICVNSNQTTDLDGWFLEDNICNCIKLRNKKRCLRDYFGKELSLFGSDTGPRFYINTSIVNLNESCKGKENVEKSSGHHCFNGF